MTDAPLRFLRGKALPCGALFIVLTASSSAQQRFGLDHLRIVAPAAPGGGWDQTARAMQAALSAEGLVGLVEVENIPGAAGTIGLARFVNTARGNETALLVTGLVMMGAIVTNGSPVSLSQVTPIARVTGEYEAIVVPAGSPFRTMNNLVAAFRSNPGAVSWAGGSAGGTDQILVGLIARAAGGDADKANYVAFAGGGEAVAALLGNQVSAGVSGLGEFAAQVANGSLRALAISSSARVPGLDVPTLKEQGLDVELANWRGIVAPPGISIAARQRLIETIDRMVAGHAWRRTLARTGWADLYLPGDRFGAFLRAEQTRIGVVIRSLTPANDRAQAGRASALVFPAIVAIGLLAIGIGLVIQRLRSGSDSGAEQQNSAGGRGFSHAPGNLRAASFVGAGAILNLLLVERAGFVVASSILFWCAARGFGSRRPLRDVVVAIALAVTAYLVFTRGLSLALPAGVVGKLL